MHIAIIANGWLNQPLDIHPNATLIAADGGARHCLELGLRPDYVIGDLDSLEEQHLQELHRQGTNIVRYPSRKDFTDLELAVQQAIELGASEIAIYGALGARWDQTIANLLLPIAYPGVRIWLVDGQQEIHLLRGGEELHLSGQPGDTLSLLPLTAEAGGITTHNLEYPLENETLFLGSTRGVSNVLLNSPAKIVLEKGLLLCTLIHTP